MELGGRMGWRLPTVEELTSLVDRTQSSPPLPDRNPFLNVQSNYYWTSSTYPYNDATLTHYAQIVYLGSSGWVSGNVKSTSYNYWCVRGGTSHNAP